MRQGPIPDTITEGALIGEPGTVYLRAHAEVEGGDFWSDEVVVKVAAQD